MGMGFAPTWLRQVSPPPCFTSSHDHFNHCIAIVIVITSYKQTDLLNVHQVYLDYSVVPQSEVNEL